MKRKIFFTICFVIALIVFIGLGWKSTAFQDWQTYLHNVLVADNCQLYVTGNTTLGDASTDVITATGYFTTIRIGTGATPGITPGADDLFVEGTAEIDGELQVDGILDINSTSDFAGNAVFNANITLGDAGTDVVTFTGYATQLRIGTGATPGITMGADNVFIEGSCEVDGELQADGILDVNSTSDFADTAVFTGLIDANGQLDVAKAITIQLVAGASLSKGNVVVLIPDDVEDLMNSYANQSAFQGVYVDSDGSHKMVDEETTSFATGLKALKLLAVNPNNTGDSVAKTISSKDMSALTIHILARASATSGDWQIRIGTGDLTTNYYQSAIVVTAANTYQHLSFLVSDMTAAGGSEDNAAITRIGFYCVDDTGGPSLLVDRIWYTSGTGDYVAKKTDSDNWDLMPPIGIVYETIADGDTGGVAIGGILDGFTGLVPGAKYYVDDATAGAMIVSAAEAAVDALVGIAISETQLLILCNGSVN